MKKTFLTIILFIILTPVISFGQYFNEIEKDDLNGNEIVLSKLLEKGPVMISFWATWCSPCKEEMKKMQPIYEKYKDQGFTYLAISQDNQKSVSKVKSFINANKYTFPVIFDLDKKIFENYSGVGIPYSLIIDKNKNIVAKHLGYITGDEVKIEKEIEDALSGNDAQDIKDESK
ncbi:MAG TPA: TlpA disulfide reductase family protein [Ignavibacteria bacterium]|nr:TlpA disulfide reductase family protein [Ignavibacteria bacterium]HMR39754.1 TlpA disulfide reductase family protein [Ignavibacteria bacterium]